MQHQVPFFLSTQQAPSPCSGHHAAASMSPPNCPFPNTAPVFPLPTIQHGHHAASIHDSSLDHKTQLWNASLSFMPRQQSGAFFTASTIQAPKQFCTTLIASYSPSCCRSHSPVSSNCAQPRIAPCPQHVRASCPGAIHHFCSCVGAARSPPCCLIHHALPPCHQLRCRKSTASCQPQPDTHGAMDVPGEGTHTEVSCMQLGMKPNRLQPLHAQCTHGKDAARMSLPTAFTPQHSPHGRSILVFPPLSQVRQEDRH